ncbi:hypothetical protein F0562_016996 [Nyssa sinensis]|uniref:Uncharacterized protein n=1 Tax=Nyssa sinensis TaxID=561372 RepID=A0A5J4ZG95_9ASTE|nr:hypothetical protein F0562_016996 [Nyssa sinensis]
MEKEILSRKQLLWAKLVEGSDYPASFFHNKTCSKMFRVLTLRFPQQLLFICLLFYSESRVQHSSTPRYLPVRHSTIYWLHEETDSHHRYFAPLKSSDV